MATQECNDLQIIGASQLDESIHKQHLNNRHIFINGEIDDSIIEKAIMYIELWNYEDYVNRQEVVGYSGQPIVIYLNTPGGYCTSGLALISAMEQSPTPITTIATGHAESMGFAILVAGHIRLAYRHAVLMYHQISSGMYGRIEEHMSNVGQLENMQKRIDKLVTSRTLITQAQIKKARVEQRDLVMFPEEAYELGVIDELLDQQIKMPKPKKPKKRSK